MNCEMFSRSRCDLQLYMFPGITASSSLGAGCHFLHWRRGNTTSAAVACRPGRPKVQYVGILWNFHEFGEIPHILRNSVQKQKITRSVLLYLHSSPCYSHIPGLGRLKQKEQNSSKLCEIPQNVRKSANFASSPPKAASVSWSRRITPVLEAGGGPGAPFAHFAPKSAISAQNTNFHYILTFGG